MTPSGKAAATAPKRRRDAAWDLTALLNAADPRANLAERHLWLIRLLEWLRHAPVDADTKASLSAASPSTATATPRPVLRLRHLLGVLERNPEHQDRVARLLQRFWREVDSPALLADFGFAPRTGLWSEMSRRLRARVLPLTPETTDLGELFALLFPRPDDADWLRALDATTLERLRLYVSRVDSSDVDSSDVDSSDVDSSGVDSSGVDSSGVDSSGAGSSGADPSRIDPSRVDSSSAASSRVAESRRPPAPADDAPDADWRLPFLDAIMFLASAVRAAGFSPALRQRMSPELLAEKPFRQLAQVAERVREQAQDGRGEGDDAALLREAQYLRALLESCRRCAESVHAHLESHGVSVDIDFEIDQLLERTHRIDSLLTCVVSPAPAIEIAALLADLVSQADERRSLRALLSKHYSTLARKVAERSARTGEHYITRDDVAYRQMLAAAAGGGAVLSVTTIVKFLVLGLTLSAFWGGFWAGVNYAASFVIVQLLHFTVATKQPAMTASAMAQKLGDIADDRAVERFVDEVAHLIRSQAAGIFGNLVAVTPLVLAIQYATGALFGQPIVHGAQAHHVLDSLTLLGPTALYAAFTGVLLFASSLVAGWCENWFVWHRLDSAIAWNPRIVGRLGAARAQRWGRYARRNVSGFASNVSLGLMLGIVPVVAVFFGLPIEVRHITLSTGQLAAAVGSEGFGLMRHAPFWWCVAGIVVTGLLNLTVSFFLAFKVALRSRGLRLADRSRIYRAIRARLWSRPLSFVWPSSARIVDVEADGDGAA